MPSNKRRGWLTPDLAQIVSRFPVPLATSIAFAIVANLEIAGIIGLPSFRWNRPQFHSVSLDQVYSALVASFFASGGAHLFAEGRRWGRLWSSLLALVCAAVVGLICWNMRLFDVQFLFLLPALVLAVTVAGYLRSDGDENALWMFNARLALAILTAIVVGVIFGAGLSAIVESLNYLFGTDIGSDAHEHIWTTAATLIAPVAGLSMVSDNLDEAFQPDGEQSLMVNGVSRILNYLLVPLALVYVVILHLYAAKMLIEWELPKGQVGIMVLIFALGGAAVWLIASPWRNNGSAMVRLFERAWFWFLVVPLIILGIGIWRRISDYGLTPERYGLVAIGFWALLVIGFCSIVARSAVPRLVLASLAVVLFVSSFGPWGARTVSARSQYDRLVELMRVQGYFEGSGLTVPEAIETSAAREGASIVRYLSSAGHIDLLKPLFDGAKDNPFDGTAAVESDQIARQLHFADATQTTDAGANWTPVEFMPNRPITLDLSVDSVFSGPHRIGATNVEGDAVKPYILLTSDRISVLRGPDSWNLDTETLLKTVLETRQAGGANAPLVFTLDGVGGKAQLVLLAVSGRLERDRPVVFNGSANLVLPASSR